MLRQKFALPESAYRTKIPYACLQSTFGLCSNPCSSDAISDNLKSPPISYYWTLIVLTVLLSLAGAIAFTRACRDVTKCFFTVTQRENSKKTQKKQHHFHRLFKPILAESEWIQPFMV